MHLLWRHWQDAANVTTSRSSTTLLDARGMTQKVTNVQLSTVEHAYDAAGNLVRTTRSANTGGTMATALTYDLRGRKLTLSDPDTGSYGYTYNAFGELLKQTDGKNQATDSLYDKLGRVTQRSSNGELISNYTYDTCTKGLGKLCSVTAKGSASPSGSAGTVGHSRTLTYDSIGRLSGETTVIATPIGTKTYIASTDFDLAGRVKTINYPNGQFATRLYDEVGAWKQLLGSNGQPLWTGGNADAEAHWLNWKTGLANVSELTTTASFGANTGRLSTLATDGAVQNLALTYDGFGNIKTRLDAINGYKQASGAAESFTYDDLNQLKTAIFQEGTQSINYDGFGRITAKTDPGAASFSYQYRGSSVSGGGSTSNRLQSANGRTYTYDDGGGLPGNGNVTQIDSTAAGTVTLSWTAFNQPLTLPVAAAQNPSATATGNANAVITLKYGADNQRVLELLPTDNSVTGANQTASRYVLHSGASLFYEEDVRADGTIEQRAYLTGPLGVVAVHTTNSDGIPTATYPLGTPVTPTGAQLNAQNNNGTPYTLTYWHRDHLGSLTVTTDDTGQVKERLRFDPWGKPMTPLGSKARTGDRGFTGHEHLAGGLIHMNGRIYDPVLGRFLSADIVVQFPSAITSYNRYAYVMNNPLAFTDPSGYFVAEIIAIYTAIAASYGTLAMIAAIAFDISVIGAAIAAATGHMTAARRFLAAAITFATAGTSYAVIGAFAAGGVQSGSLEGAVVAGLSAAFFAAAGGIADAGGFEVGSLGRAGMHVGAGAMRSMLTGTDPLRGGLAAGFAEIAGPLVSGTGVGIENFVAHVVAGGVGEAMGGGKFKNGAMTAAFAWLYNHLGSDAKSYRDHFGYGGDGHHPVPAAALVGHDMSEAMGQEFAKFKISDIGPHGNSREHILYNKAVGEELSSWAKTNNVDLAKGTSADARRFMTHLAESEHPHIKSFNTAIVSKALDNRRSPFSRFLRGAGGSGLAGAAALMIVDVQLQNHLAEQHFKQCAAAGGKC
jgi:RHS repeat-associated protein